MQSLVRYGILFLTSRHTYLSFAGHSISKKLGINVVANESMDLFRGIRTQLASLLDGLDPKDLATMSLGLSHSLSRCAVLVFLSTFGALMALP